MTTTHCGNCFYTIILYAKCTVFQTLGKVVSLPQPFVALVSMDAVPGNTNVLYWR